MSEGDPVSTDVTVNADSSAKSNGNLKSCNISMDIKEENADSQNCSQIDKIFNKRRRLAKNSGETQSTKADESVKNERRGGRKKRQPRRYVDPSVKLNTIQLNNKLSKKNQRKSTDPLENVELVCGICDEKFQDKIKSSYHIFSVHNGLARMNSKEPFSPSEENEALRLCLRRLKKLQCPRPDCQKHLTTLPGYKAHLQTCGSMERVPCSKCHALLRPMSLPSHMKLAHEQRAKLSASIDGETIESQMLSKGRSSRKAAERARKSVQLFSIDMNSNKKSLKGARESDNDVVEEELIAERLISRDDLNVTIPSKVMEIWRLEIDKDGMIKCKSQDCFKTFTSIAGMKYHYQRCGRDMDYTCQKCGFKSDKKLAIKKHVMIHFTSGDENDKDNDNTSISNEKNDIFKPEVFQSHYFRPSLKSNPYTCYLPTFMDTFKLSHVNKRHILFDSWFPTSESWTLLSFSEYEAYLPFEKYSVKFKTKKKDKKSLKKKQSSNYEPVDDNGNKWSSLPLFGSTGETDSYTATMFVGGAVRSLAWCPTPSANSIENVHEQYLAVAADLEYEDMRDARVFHTRNGPSMIQLWSMGVMQKKKLTCLPKISFCIAHDYGQVKCMEWCSGGCYNVNGNDGEPTRIGLLAIGCSDGNIYIYSVPKPEFFSENTDEDELLVTKPTPIVQLKPPRCNVVACMSLSWYSAGDRNKIIGGFGNGLVCVWDLTTKSQLLWQETDNGTSTLVPFLTFMPHLGPVTCVAWCPNTDCEHFCTGSVDKELKMWAINDTEHPLLTIKKTIVTDCYWSPLACGIFCTYDDSYQYKQNRTYYYECGYYGHPARCLAYHNSCVMKMSFSEWLNTVVTCDYAGEIAAVVCYQYQEMFRKKKNHRLYKIVPITQTTVENLKDDADLQESGEADHLEMIEAVTYEEISQTRGLVFHDTPVYNFLEMPADSAEHVNSADTMNAQPFQNYNLQTINSVSWNQNCGAHFWLASGYNAGFVRLHCISGLDNKSIYSIDFPKLKEVLKTDPSATSNTLQTTDSGELASDDKFSTPMIDRNPDSFFVASPAAHDQDNKLPSSILAAIDKVTASSPES